MRERSKSKRAKRGVALWARPIVWAFRMLFGRPRESALALVCTGAVGAIVVNGLYLQPGPHPAPIFIVKRPPVVLDEPTGSVTALPRPRPPEAPQPEFRPEPRPRTDIAHGKLQHASVRQGGSRPDPIADLLATPRPRPNVTQQTAATSTTAGAAPQASSGASQLISVQRTLSDFGYGPVAATGVYGPETREAIERFERERKLPVTGQVSERLLRELAQLAGKPI
ncbi:MAG TPA: peptidoglycan-binding domain-containing protein [Xanthobacteraceae bacterium]|nr:peptidoglycan-binding domain-containing protein [Xanthobacteraceae bacterium]